MKLKLSRRAATLTGTALAVSSLPLLTLSTSASADETPAPVTTTYTKTLKYNCDVTTEFQGTKLVLDENPITAKVSFALPKLDVRNVDLDPTQISVQLQLSEDLRGATTGLLEGVAADGQSTNTVLSVTRNDEGTSRRYYRIPKLAAEKTAIPTEPGQPWLIDAKGESPSIPVPYATKTTIAGPEQFDIDSTIYKADGTELPTGLSCDAAGPKTVATIKIGEAPKVTAAVKPSVVKARTKGAVLNVKVAASVPPGNRVIVYKESGTVGKFSDELASYTLQPSDDGVAKIALPAFGQRGKRALRVYYEGDERVDPKLVTAKFTVK